MRLSSQEGRDALVTFRHSTRVRIAYLGERCASRAFVDERYRVHCAAPVFNFGGTDHLVRCPIPAFDQDIGFYQSNQRQRCIVVEPGHQVHRFERGEQRHAVGERVDRTFRTFAKASCRSIAVGGDEQTFSERARLREIARMAAVQNVEYAVAEYQRPRQLRDARSELRGLADFGFEGWDGIHSASVTPAARVLQISVGV
jgi:hypothetical protein